MGEGGELVIFKNWLITLKCKEAIGSSFYIAPQFTQVLKSNLTMIDHYVFIYRTINSNFRSNLSAVSKAVNDHTLNYFLHT